MIRTRKQHTRLCRPTLSINKTVTRHSVHNTNGRGSSGSPSPASARAQSHRTRPGAHAARLIASPLRNRRRSTVRPRCTRGLPDLDPGRPARRPAVAGSGCRSRRGDGEAEAFLLRPSIPEAGACLITHPQGLR
jgi:hypothetical protein